MENDIDRFTDDQLNYHIDKSGMDSFNAGCDVALEDLKVELENFKHWLDSYKH